MSRTAPAGLSAPARTVRLLATLVMIAGVLLLAAGVATWVTVQTQLADERITVSDDASFLAGDEINGPFSAYAEAQVIEKHALESSKGKTYAELDREDPTRQTVMTGSFLRASLFTSVVSFGVAAMAMGIGVLLALIGYALFLVSRQLSTLSSRA